MTARLNSIALALAASFQVFGAIPEPEEFLRAGMQLVPDQITAQNGKAFARILPASYPSDIYVAELFSSARSLPLTFSSCGT